MDAETRALILAAIERRTADMRTPEQARAYLIGLGIYTPQGGLTKEYGGDGQ